MMDKERQVEYIDKIIEFCFIALVFVLPIAHTRAIRAVLMFLPAVLWIYAMILRKEKLFIKNQLTVPWAIFIVFVGLSLFTSVDLKYSVRELFGTIVNFLLFCLFLNNIKDMKQVNRIILSLLLASLVQGAYSTIHFFASHRSLLDYISYEHGFEVDHKYYSTFLITVLPFILYKIMTSRRELRFAFIGLLMLNLFMLLASQQRGAWVAAIVEIIIFFWYVNRKILFLVFGMTAVVFIILPSDVLYHGKKGIDFEATASRINENSINPRIGIWKFSLNEIASHPFTGFGIGRRNFIKKYIQFQNTETWHAHNIFLELALELGVQGLLAFIFLVYVLIRTSWEGLKKTTGESYYWFLASLIFLTGFFVRNMFDDLYIDDLVQMFWALSGLSAAVFLKIENIPYDRIFLSVEHEKRELMNGSGITAAKYK